jgi:hypothetical protein
VGTVIEERRSVMRDQSQGGEVQWNSREKEDIWSVGMLGEPVQKRAFRIDYRGRLVFHQLPFLVWLAITGVASSALSVLTVWVVWG